MTSSPPDISSLTLAPQRTRPLNDSYDQSFQDRLQHFQTSPALVPTPAHRRALPSNWLAEQEAAAAAAATEARSLSPPQTSDLSSGGGSPPSTTQNMAAVATGDDEIIPTAIVIKNIPFNVKREMLLDIIASLAIPTPYAFNYHLDPAGQFRGLAFANFRLAADADAVVAALNGFDVQGRKLRVEYKKVLQAGEKERIEREKAIRRMRSMQIEKEREQMASQGGSPMSNMGGGGVGAGYDDGYSPLQPPQLMSSSRSFSGTLPLQFGAPAGGQSPAPMPPMPIPQPYTHAGQQSLQTPQQQQQQQQPAPGLSKSTTELDMNDAATLEIYSRILLFKDDHMRDELAFSRSLSPKQRRIVHLVAQRLGVYHYSVGEGEERYAVVTRREPADRMGGGGSTSGTAGERIGPVRHHSSQALNRSFVGPNSASGGNSSPFGSTAPSSFNQGPGGLSQGMTNGAGGGLRSKKSMPDMKSLYSTASSRLTSRSSNGNIREGYASFASPIRRTPTGPPPLGQIFSQSGSISAGSGMSSGSIGIPPVPSIPSLPSNLDGTNGSGSRDIGGVVRQPRGPGAGGFTRRRESAIGPVDISRAIGNSGSSGGLDTGSREPLEI